MNRLALAMLALPLATSALAAAEEIDETLPVEPGGTLTINLDRGRVEVESHDADEVRIAARAEGLFGFLWEFELTEDGRNVRLDGWFQRLLFFLPWGPRVRVRAWVPREYSVEVRTGGGSIAIGHIEGRVTASTSGGKIVVAEVKGPIDVETSGGPIEVGNVVGNVTASTSGGAIDLLRIDGMVDAVTSGGRITTSFAGPPSGSLETSGGAIEVRFSANARVDLDAETSGGRVDVDHVFTARDESSRNRVAGQINGGGPPLRLRTSGGNIDVRAAA